MNRYGKEEIKKHKAAREGLTLEQIQALDAQEMEKALISRLARKMHVSHFPEEYDWMYDEHVDSNARKKGENPMSDEYIEKTRKKRERQGVSPLKENGEASSNETMRLCEQLITVVFHQLRQRVDEILFYKWDPLEFSDSNLPRDEYANYLEQVFILAVNEHSAKPLAEHLSTLTVNAFGLSENMKHNTKIAELIYSIVNELEHSPSFTEIVLP